MDESLLITMVGHSSWFAGFFWNRVASCRLALRLLRQAARISITKTSMTITTTTSTEINAMLGESGVASVVAEIFGTGVCREHRITQNNEFENIRNVTPLLRNTSLDIFILAVAVPVDC